MEKEGEAHLDVEDLRKKMMEAELEAEADEPDGEADHEAPEGAELVAPRPEDGEEEDGADGRSQVAGHGLR